MDESINIEKNDSPKGEEDVIPVPVVIYVDSNGGL